MDLIAPLEIPVWIASQARFTKDYMGELENEYTNRGYRRRFQ